MKSVQRDYAVTGLGLIILAWILVSLVEIVDSPASFVRPVSRMALVAGLAVGVSRGNRAASGVLLAWSIVGILLGGFWGALLVLATGVTLFLFAGGSEAFRPKPPAIESDNSDAVKQ